MNRLQRFLVESLKESNEFEGAVKGLSFNNNIYVTRLPGSSLSLFLAVLSQRLARPICLLTALAEVLGGDGRNRA